MFHDSRPINPSRSVSHGLYIFSKMWYSKNGCADKNRQTCSPKFYCVLRNLDEGRNEGGKPVKVLALLNLRSKLVRGRPKLHL